MSYDKPVKSCFDAPLGLRTINQLVSNQDAQRELLELEHVPQPSVTAGPFAGSVGGHAAQLVQTPGLDSQGGAHDTPKVARGEMVVVADPLFLTMRATMTTGVCTGFVRLETGKYFVPILGLASFEAMVFPIYDSVDTAARMMSYAPAGSGAVGTGLDGTNKAPGLFISAFREAVLLSSNIGFDYYDMSFHLVVYGYREEPLPTASELAVTRRRRTLATKPFNRGPFKRHQRR